MADYTNESATEKAHGLLCPSCRVDLVMSERQGVEIDYCQKCRGVWLDRGELDKLIERSQGQPRGRAMPAQTYPDASGYGHHGSSHGDHGKHGYRRKSWLSEIFD